MSPSLNALIIRRITSSWSSVKSGILASPFKVDTTLRTFVGVLFDLNISDSFSSSKILNSLQLASYCSKNFSPIEIYRREDSYYTSTEKYLLGRVRNKPVCLIKFGGDKNIFKTDYANYVIHYFEQNYPEFNWAGVEM